MVALGQDRPSLEGLQMKGKKIYYNQTIAEPKNGSNKNIWISERCFFPHILEHMHVRIFACIHPHLAEELIGTSLTGGISNDETNILTEEDREEVFFLYSHFFERGHFYKDLRGVEEFSPELDFPRLDGDREGDNILVWG